MSSLVRSSKYGWMAFALLVAFAVVLAACQPAPTPTQSPSGQPSGQPAAPKAAPAAEQKLSIGIGALAKSIDPNFDSGLHANATYSLLYDTLFRVDDKGNLLPGLVESWKTLDDKTWEFSLRKGVKFHNGEPWNAEAAKFNLERIADAKTKSVWAARFSMVDRVEVVDEYTVRMITKQPWAMAAKTAFLTYAVPPKYIQEKGDAGFATAPVGTGPFKFKEWKQDVFLTVEANPDYWGGAPKLSGVTIRAYPESSTMVAALEKGEIDLAYGVPPDDTRRLTDKGFNLVARDLGHSLVFILRTTVGGPLADKRVRQAINHAVDRKVIVEKLMGGYGRILDGQVVGPEAFGYNPALQPYPYDLAKAKQLLADAGYPNGFKVKLHGAQGRWIKDKEVSEAVATQLADVGIQAELEILEAAVWMDLWTKGESGPIVINASSWAPLLDPEQAMPFYLSDSTRNIMKNPQYDALYHKAAVTLDFKEREKVLHEMLALFREEAPMIFMYQIPGIYAINKKVQGADFTAYYAMKNLTGISIK